MMLQAGCSTIRHGGTHARNHLQFHASARTPRGSGRETRARQFTLEQAGKYLQEKVPMDEGTARQEAIASPQTRQALNLSNRQTPDHETPRRRANAAGRKFSLRAFHDFVWKNGNVPTSRCNAGNYLGVADDVPPLPK